LKSDNAWREIDLDGLRKNLNNLKTPLKNRILLIDVRGDARNHGADAVVFDLDRLEKGLWYYVSDYNEAANLRKYTESPILVSRGINPIYPPNVDIENVYPVIDFSNKMAPKALAKKTKLGKASAYLRVDNMDLGPESFNNTVELINQQVNQTYISYLGLYMGLSPLLDQEIKEENYKRYSNLLDALKRKGVHFETKILDAGHIISYDEERLIDVAKIGNELFGLDEEKIFKDIDLKRTWGMKTMVIEVLSKTNDARIPIGYSDGLNTKCCDKLSVLIKGKKSKLSGIMMNESICDISGISDVRSGDEVVIVGRQGDEIITFEDHAECGGTISDEILTNLGLKLDAYYSNRNSESVDA